MNTPFKALLALALAAVMLVCGYRLYNQGSDAPPKWETCVATECFPGCDKIDDKCRSCLQECVARYED